MQTFGFSRSVLNNKFLANFDLSEALVKTNSKALIRRETLFGKIPLFAAYTLYSITGPFVTMCTVATNSAESRAP